MTTQKYDKTWLLELLQELWTMGWGHPTLLRQIPYNIIFMKQKKSYRWTNWTRNASWHLILVSNLSNTFNESPCGQFSWTIHSLSIIIWSPGGTVNIDMLRIEAQRSGFHCVSNVSIQHPHTCALTVMRLQTDHTLSTNHYTMWTLQLRHLCHPRNKKCWTQKFECCLRKFSELVFIIRFNLTYAWA